MSSGERPWTLGEVFVLRHAGFPFDWLESLGMSSQVLDALAGLDDQTPPAQRAAVETAYRTERERLRHRLRELARHPKVQEAVFLSSPDMYENVWVRYLGATNDIDNSDSRRVERQVYAYLQRLCAKNETTSFFGPMGYGAVEVDGDVDDDVVAFAPAVARRRTFVAYWAVEALAARIAVEPDVWPQLPMRRNPLFRIEANIEANIDANIECNQARCDSIGLVVPLSADQLRLLGAVETASQSPELAAQLDEPLAWVEAVALSLFATGVLLRRLWFRSDEADTLGGLRAALRSQPDSAGRSRWLDQLDELDGLRGQFEVAALDERRTLLARMEALFTSLARVPARRAGGRLYTDRLILNEEASSPFRLRVGRAAAQKLAAALSPLLEVAAAHGQKVQEQAVGEVTRRLGSTGQLSFLAYAAALRDSTTSLPCPTVEASAEPRAALAHDRFGLSSPGHRFALPDVCLSRQPDGSLRPLLARMHHQLLTPGWLFTFHDNPARAAAVAARWLADEPTTLVELASGRHNKGYYSFPGLRAAHASAELVPRTDGVMAAADLTVTLTPDGPALHGRDGAPLRLYLPLADLTLHPPFAALAHPPVVKAPIVGEGGHTPRLEIGTATYQRESWVLSLAGWDKLSGLTLFQRLQQERRRLGLPRFVFARVPSERKPFLVDTECPFAVELLRAQGRTAEVSLEEMSPAPDELWLRDEHGRYTFELRMQAARAA